MIYSYYWCLAVVSSDQDKADWEADTVHFLYVIYHIDSINSTSGVRQT